MNLSFICKALVAMAMVTAATASPSQALDLCPKGCKKTDACCDSSAACCPKCNYCCELEAEVVDAEKTCFEVEEKVICIPRVVFPWQSGDCCLPFCGKKKKSTCTSCDGRGCSSCNNCVHNGAKIRKVRVLTTKKYKCPECEYSWTPEKTGCCIDCSAYSGCCGGSDCDGGSCDDGCDIDGYTPVPAIQVRKTQPAQDEVLPPATDKVMSTPTGKVMLPTDPVLAPPIAYGNTLPFSPVLHSLPKLGLGK